MAGLDQCDQEHKVATNYDIKSRVSKTKDREKNRRLLLTGIKTYKQEKKKRRVKNEEFSSMAE